MALAPYTGYGLDLDPFGFGTLTDPFGTLGYGTTYGDLLGGYGFGNYGAPSVGRGTTRAGGVGPLTTTGGRYPMDMIETANTYEIYADAPGMRPEDITVDVSDDGVLMIRGEHTEERNKRDEMGRVYRTERTRRSFQRNFQLPANTDRDNVSADLDRGELLVTVPKKDVGRMPKRITVGGRGTREAIGAGGAGAGTTAGTTAGVGTRATAGTRTAT